MLRTLCVWSAIALLLATSAAALSADGDEQRAARPVWGTVVKVSADSITVQPEPPAPPRRRRQNQNPAPPAPPPAERTFALSNDQTEYTFAEVGARMMMNDGSTLRTLHDPEPATAADVKPGQFVEVTPAEGADDAPAARVIIVWSVRGTIVKVNGDSITFRPGPDPSNRPDASARDTANPADAKPDAADDDDADQTLKLTKDTTIRMMALTEVRPAENGRGIRQSFRYQSATRADLKADQTIDVCIKDGTAVKITINQVVPAKP